MSEQFKPVKGYESLYEVSDLGNVKSLKRTIIQKNRKTTVPERILKPSKDNNGYLQVVLSKDNKTRTIKIHKLVALAFLNHTTNGSNIISIDHINNISGDNRLCNLQIISGRQNWSKDKTPKSGFTGAYYHKKSKRWEAKITINSKLIYLGIFDTPELAHQEYLKNLKRTKTHDKA
jgi:hypothetical protein